MPSRIRVLLKSEAQKRALSGKRAIAVAIALIRRSFLDAKIPDGWNEMSLRNKLVFIGDKLPKGYQLMFIREPRNTRKNKSLFLETRGIKENAAVELER